MKMLIIKTHNLYDDVLLGFNSVTLNFSLKLLITFFPPRLCSVLCVQIFQLGLMIAFSASLGVFFIIYLCVFMDVQVQLFQVYIDRMYALQKNQTVFNLALIYVYITVGLISDCFLVLYRSLLDSYIDIKKSTKIATKEILFNK